MSRVRVAWVTDTVLGCDSATAGDRAGGGGAVDDEVAAGGKRPADRDAFMDVQVGTAFDTTVDAGPGQKVKVRPGV